ncbi:MAG TPA: glutamate--tRNA ligase [Candidatus Saccharimonadales bacterium]|nr:glutamate--tRNA ligase [Candidatus Saccharimonadales bacterium]
MVRQGSTQVYKHDSNRPVRTRIPPSPTGEDIHVGNLYTALINFAVARKNNGKFIIRIEDTDRQRYQKGAEEKILSSIKKFNLNYDEGPDIGGPHAPYRQSERLSIYDGYAKELIDKGDAYYCFCTKERLIELRENQIKENKKTGYDKHCLLTVKNADKLIKKNTPFVVRLNVRPDKKICFKDIIRGEITIDSSEIDDQVLLKSDGYPTYHLGVVVDDHLMEITHIIRAEEWISSTPKHVLLYESFGWEMPIFAHLPILRNPDKSKLSKRKNPVWASWYLKEGFLPEAMLNYLALLGWSHPEEKEIFSLTEFINLFKLEDVKPVGPIFDLVKLKWMNQQYIQMKSDKELMKLILDFSDKSKKLSDEALRKLIPLLKSRMETLLDFERLTGVFFDEIPVVDFDDKEKEIAKTLIEDLSKIEDWKSDAIFNIIKGMMEKSKTRMPIFYKIFTGVERGLPLPETLEILGKNKSIKRLTEVIK